MFRRTLLRGSSGMTRRWQPVLRVGTRYNAVRRASSWSRWPVASTSTFAPKLFRRKFCASAAPKPKQEDDADDADVEAQLQAKIHKLESIRAVDSATRSKQLDAEEGIEEEPEWLRRSRTAVYAMSVGLLLFGYWYRKQNAGPDTEIKVTGKPKLGCDWQMTDSNGQNVSSEEFRGRFQLLYFGFTHCPDICPTELRKMSAALYYLEDKHPDLAGQIQPIFVSVDSKRDTCERLKAFKKHAWSSVKAVKEGAKSESENDEEGDDGNVDIDTLRAFLRPGNRPAYHDRFIYLRAAEARINSIARAFKVYFQINEPEPGAPEDEYLIDHSIYFFFLDKNNQFVDVLSHNLNEAEMGRKLERLALENIGENEA